MYLQREDKSTTKEGLDEILLQESKKEMVLGIKVEENEYRVTVVRLRNNSRSTQPHLCRIFAQNV